MFCHSLRIHVHHTTIPLLRQQIVTNDRAEFSGRLNEKYCYTVNTFITLNILFTHTLNTKSQIIHSVTITLHHSPSMAGTQLCHMTRDITRTGGRFPSPGVTWAFSLGRIPHHHGHHRHGPVVRT